MTCIRTIFIVVAYTICTELAAQHVLTKDELKFNWRHRNDTTSLINFDIIGNDHYYITQSEQLRSVGNIELPPSCWMFFCEEGAGNYKCSPLPTWEERCILCWVGIREDDAGKEKSIRKRLSKQYGLLTGLYEGIVCQGVPAQWFDGQIYIAENIEYRLGNWVSGEYSKHNYTIKHGEFFEPEEDDTYESDISQECMTVYDISTIYDDLFRYHYDPTLRMHIANRTYEEGRQFQLDLLANNVALFNPHTQLHSADHYVRNMPIYIHQSSEDGHISMEVIGDDTYSDIQWQEIDRLKHAFASLPPYTYKKQYYTLQGILDGEILYAHYNYGYLWVFSYEPK